MISPSPRILPFEPPYSSEIETALRKWMPPDVAVEPLKLFRTLYHNKQISDRMRPLGAGILGHHGSIEPYEREILIDRTCARCGCEYEWGVHVSAYGDAVGLSQAQVQQTVTGHSQDSLWTEREQTLLALVDELHETSTISDKIWNRLAEGWDKEQIIEMIVIVGWYHLISYVANAIHIENEPWAARFPYDEQ